MPVGGRCRRFRCAAGIADARFDCAEGSFAALLTPINDKTGS